MLQYASLKTVLQYLDANIRFEIYNRCPSIRKIERTVPLYMNRLRIIPLMNGTNVIAVDSTRYSIGTIRVYPAGAQIPNEHEVENMNGGVGWDLDRFGFEDYTSESHLTPGDIRVGQPRRVWRLEENLLDGLIQEAEALEMMLALRRGGKPFILDRQHPQYFLMQQFENQSNKVIRKFVRRRRHTLLPYMNRRNNIAEPFTTEVQMTVNNFRGAEKVHRYPGKKVYQVEKKLLTLFFASRKHIYVKSLEIYNAKILRFPVDMFFKIQRLYVFRYTFEVSEAISKFVNPASFPLETIKFSDIKVNEIQHDIVKSAKKLIIAGLCGNMQTLLKMTTQKVEIEGSYLSPEHYLVLARNWLETGRTVGTCYVFNLKDDCEVDEVMRLLKTELNAEAVGAECLKVRINDTSKLKIAHQKVEEKWRMQFKVIYE